MFRQLQQQRFHLQTKRRKRRRLCCLSTMISVDHCYYYNDYDNNILRDSVSLSSSLSLINCLNLSKYSSSLSLMLLILLINNINCHNQNETSSSPSSSASSKSWTEFEAAFQGECRRNQSNPCQQLCFDLYDGTFECACENGYHLHLNGYSCILNTENDNHKHHDQEHHHHHKHDQYYYYHNHNNNQFDSIQSEQIEQIKQQQQPFKSSISNRINTFKTTSTTTAAAAAAAAVTTPVTTTTIKTPTTKIQQTLSAPISSIPQSPYHQIQSSSSIIDPLSSLYSCNDIECEAGGVCIENPLSSSSIRIIDYYTNNNNNDNNNDDDNSYNSRNQQKSMVRCKCPLGRGGQFCEKIIEVKQPHFMGSSYLALPTLRNAHRSLKINIEFKPKSYDGIILYSGQETNLDGDFIAIVLVQGFVEFRFDCGMGEGIIRSDMPVILNSWNQIDIYRDGHNAWMQLNQGQQIFGHSKGLFSRITFRLETFLGGSPNISQIMNRIGVNKGLIGCIKQLMINDRQYDFYNDTIDGIDIDQCNSDACNHVTCLNGGHCTVDSSSNNDKRCICPLGYTGEFCEQQIEYTIPSFNGSSYLQFVGIGDKQTMFTEILIIIKPYESNGLFFYNGERMDKSGDFISLNLVDGYVEFRFDLGTGAAILRSPEKINMKEWHTIYASRTGREGLLRVDDQPIAYGQSLGAFIQLSLPLNLYVGGVSNLNEIHHNAGAQQLFKGCVQKIQINRRQLSLLRDVLTGVNIDNCQHPCSEHRPCQNNGHCEPIKHYYHCHCLTNEHFGQHCEHKLNTGLSHTSKSYPMFYGNSFLRYSNPKILNRVQNGFKTIIHLNLRAFSSNGLIFWFGELRKNPNYLIISLNDGHVNVDIKYHNHLNHFIVNTTRIDDGQWHQLDFHRIGRQIFIHIDNNITIHDMIDNLSINNNKFNNIIIMNDNNIQSALYLGGLENMAITSINNDDYNINDDNNSSSNYHYYYEKGFIGCISNMTIDNDYIIDLMSDSDRGVNIRTCI